MLRNRFRSALLAPAFLLSSLAFAQFQTPTQVQDTSILKPPPGSKIAIIEFADLECPVCGHDNPILMDAVAKYHVPWLRHDFPLPQHNWSFQAAVNARWFDTKSKKIGDDYRNYVFQNQPNIETKDDLRNYTQKFASSHGLALPFVIDPQGKLTADVRADAALGDRMGVHETPTCWIVTNDYSHGRNYVQVTNFNDLYAMLDQAEAQTAHESTH
jgi:protein-disulfide isomerase